MLAVREREIATGYSRYYGNSSTTTSHHRTALLWVKDGGINTSWSRLDSTDWTRGGLILIVELSHGGYYGGGGGPSDL